jgi:hypothetical protein
MMSPSRSSSMESVRTFNPEPTFISAKNAIPEEVAKTLMDLVDEKGTTSPWYANPKCLEYQIANPFSKDKQDTDPRIRSVLPDLFFLAESCMRHINWGFKNSAFNMVFGYHGFWILKYNQGSEFKIHHDFSSGENGIRPFIAATASVLLNDNYSGGELSLYDSDDNKYTLNDCKNKLSLKIWDGFTRHSVDPITEGTRYSLVIHYTGTLK